jgi:hypothetical protein
MVTATVTPVNHPPVARDDTATTPEGTPVAIDVLANDTDPDGDLDPASVTVVSGPAHGATAIDPASGAITYTPTEGFRGLDSFSCRVADREGLSSTAVVRVEVVPRNYPPVARDDTGNLGDGTSTRIDVLANDSDPDGDLDRGSLRILMLPAAGTAVVDPATGTVVYIAGHAFNGLDLFTYEVWDTAGASATAIVVVRGNRSQFPPGGGAFFPPEQTPAGPPVPPVVPPVPPVVPPAPPVAPVLPPLPLLPGRAGGGEGGQAPQNLVTAAAQPVVIHPSAEHVILSAVALATLSGRAQEEPVFWPWLLDDLEEQAAPPERVVSRWSGPELAALLREVLYEPARAATDAVFSRLAAPAPAPAEESQPDGDAPNDAGTATDPEAAPWYLWAAPAAALLGVSNGSTRWESERRRVSPLRNRVSR